eukprot:9237712-Heterocapsa_arctica.AAC.1
MGSADAAIRFARPLRRDGVHPFGLRAAVARPSGDALKVASSVAGPAPIAKRCPAAAPVQPTAVRRERSADSGLFALAGQRPDSS